MCEEQWKQRGRKNADAYAKSEQEFFSELDKRLAEMTPEQRAKFFADATRCADAGEPTAITHCVTPEH